MIIPILLRQAGDEVPDKLKKIAYYDFSKFLITGFQADRSVETGRAMHDIANHIYSLYVDLKKLGSGLKCNSFELPSIDEVAKSWAHRRQGKPTFPR